ncbi:hypothetical protein, partial [Pseudomonas sp. PAMC 25886]|uniref:hypothetical protein n=1 Tax=Pseudomonas sp. PAMC 25886 TaxID=1125977 RepID=UPI001EE661AD
EWWGKSVLVTFALFKSDPLKERNRYQPLPKKRICTPSQKPDNFNTSHGHLWKSQSIEKQDWPWC